MDEFGRQALIGTVTMKHGPNEDRTALLDGTDGHPRQVSRARYAVLVAVLGAFAVGGCASSPRGKIDNAASLPYFPTDRSAMASTDYTVGPLDIIDITVFQVPELTVKGVQVDASGRLLLPLIGAVQASGKTTAQLSTDIAKRLSNRYLENPQVSVIVSESVSQRVTVDGSVNEAGVYQLSGPTSLLMAIAMAKGTSRVASLDDVVIFRQVGNQRMAALFNVAKIRTGEQPDPGVIGNDVVIVGLSNVKAAWRDFLTTAPLISAFRPF